MGIDSYAPKTGRMYREDDSTVNIASVISPKPFKHETLTVSSTALPLTALTYAGAMTAYVTAETAEMRYWLDGTDPTASAGHLLEAKGYIQLTSPEEIAGFIAIATTATDGVLQVTYNK